MTNVAACPYFIRNLWGIPESSNCFLTGQQKELAWGLPNKKDTCNSAPW